jgi:hypothetical protein
MAAVGRPGCCTLAQLPNQRRSLPILHQDQRDDRLRWFVPELLLQIKNAALDR